ncbi:hypothetical protein LINPERPRIM_LOCUS39780 [Linum perenne]
MWGPTRSRRHTETWLGSTIQTSVLKRIPPVDSWRYERLMKPCLTRGPVGFTTTS